MLKQCVDGIQHDSLTTTCPALLGLNPRTHTNRPAETAPRAFPHRVEGEDNAI
ncbi:hypothetical protein E2C01_064275 [Portunus trituberculatus]|uniref:Uncharacterized protein n=1 Tax=Portunus trituberculatus TaxID=210409 RepID=A0A5B7HCK7_PORTR|nr:hypothetical protein [Portunus trituberculatus]